MTINLTHSATNRAASLSPSLRVVMQGYPDGYWECVTHSHKTITPQQVKDAAEVLIADGWAVVSDHPSRTL